MLQKYSTSIYLTSYLEPEDVEIAIKSNIDWLDFPVITYKECFPMEDFLSGKSYCSDFDILFIDGNIDILNEVSLKCPEFLYILIKNSNFKCKNSFDGIKNPLIKPFIGFEDIEFKLLNSF